MRFPLFATLLIGLAAPAALAQGGPPPQRDTQPAPDRSSSSTNTPSTGQPTGRQNPSISTAPDNAPARGTPPSTQRPQ